MKKINVQKTIEQALTLNSHEKLGADAVHELRRRSTTLSGDINSFSLITESFDIGFIAGYMAAKEKAAAMSD